MIRSGNAQTGPLRVSHGCQLHQGRWRGRFGQGCGPPSATPCGLPQIRPPRAEGRPSTTILPRSTKWPHASPLVSGVFYSAHPHRLTQICRVTASAPHDLNSHRPRAQQTQADLDAPVMPQGRTLHIPVRLRQGTPLRGRRCEGCFGHTPARSFGGVNPSLPNPTPGTRRSRVAAGHPAGTPTGALDGRGRRRTMSSGGTPPKAPLVSAAPYPAQPHPNHAESWTCWRPRTSGRRFCMSWVQLARLRALSLVRAERQSSGRSIDRKTAARRSPGAGESGAAPSIRPMMVVCS